MRHRLVSILVASAALTGLAEATPAGAPRTIAEAIRQIVAERSAEIGVAADASRVTDAVRAAEAQVDALAQRMHDLQLEAAAEYRKQQQRLDSPEFEAEVREFARLRDRYVDAIEERIQKDIQIREDELKSASDRVKELESELLAMRQDFDGATVIQLQTLRNHGPAIGAAYESMSQAMGQLDDIVERKRLLEAKESSIARFIFGTRNTAALELIDDDLARVRQRVAGTVATVDGALEDYGRETLPPLDAATASADDLNRSARGVFRAVSGLVQTFEELQAKEQAVEQKRQELAEAKAEQRAARSALDQAIESTEPRPDLLEGLRLAQDQLEGLFAPHDEARDMFRAIREVALGVRACIETARAEGGAGTVGTEGMAYCSGTFRTDCESFDEEGRRQVFDARGRFRLDVAPVTVAPGADPPDELDIVGRFTDDRTGETNTHTGTLRRIGPDTWRVEFVVEGTFEDITSYSEFSGTLKGDPFSPRPFTAPGPGRMVRRDRAENMSVDCSGSWTVTP